MQKVLFLDRDGVINHDPGDYTCNWESFEFLPGVFETLRQLRDKGWRFVVITNQGGIARGRYTLDDFLRTDKLMHARFLEENIPMLETFFCPHHPETGLCLCRKPNSLLVEKALHKYKLPAEHCRMVGDKHRDIECAGGAGVKGILMPTNGALADYVGNL